MPLWPNILYIGYDINGKRLPIYDLGVSMSGSTDPIYTDTSEMDES